MWHGKIFPNERAGEANGRSSFVCLLCLSIALGSANMGHAQGTPETLVFDASISWNVGHMDATTKHTKKYVDMRGRECIYTFI